MTEMTREEILREALKSVEWVHGVCPRCSQIEPQHNLDCEIALALHDDGTVRAILDNESLPSDPLDRLAELEQAATPGEWYVAWGSGGARFGVRTKNEAEVAAAQRTITKVVSERANAAFIAALRNAAPSLIAEAREAARLRTAIEAHVAWEYRERGAPRFTLTNLRAALVKP